MMKKIRNENLTALFRLIAGGQELIAPLENGGQVNFGVWNEDAQVNLDVLKSVKSPKDAFFPQSENLYSCSRDGKEDFHYPGGAGKPALCRVRHEGL